MPSAEINSAVVTRQVEKPHHYTYLKSFRTEQCKDFLNHRCNQHRPFTCFFWHFPNQKRRRPVFNAKDGTFNYSPDVYCTSYDESTGICPQGDSCTYLHRNIGDTEKRYHLRYYKTERCIIDTENKGSCTKNGPHCAFAHGPDDLRAPVFDITERNVVNAKPADQSIEAEVNGEKEKEKIANIDPVWFDENYIKLFYKTEPCTRTSRHVTLSCPFYHNPKDRRRRHDIHKYRAVVCPEVKHKEEWTDPAECGLGDKCPYIHTRTEQQYHPDIYKTDKCHEEAANGRCSKGIFCAFAHDNPTMPQVSPVRSVSCHGENSSSNASQGKIAPGTELQSRVGRIKMPSNGNAVGQIITNGMTLQPGTGSGTNSDTDSNWLGFSSIKLDPRTNDGDIQSRLKQIQPMASEIGAFYDPAKPDYPMSMYTTTKPQASGSAMPLSNYNSGATSIESSFKAASLMPADNDTHLMDRLDSLDEDDDSNHALLGMPNSGLVGGARILPSEVPQMSIFNTAPTGTMPPPRFSPFATVGMGNSTAGLSLSSNVGFNYSLPGFPSANGGYVTGQTSRLAMYGLSLQPTEVERLKSEVDDARQIIQRLTEEKLQATQERDLLIQHHHHHQTNAMSDSALSNGTYLRRLIPSANLEALSVPYLQDIQVQLQLDLRRVQMMALAERQQMQEQNYQLQHKLADFFRRKKADDSRPEDRNMADQEQRYLKCMATLDDLRQEARVKDESYQIDRDDLQGRCAEKEEQVDRERIIQMEYRKQVALSAINSRTGKSIPPKDVEQYLNAESRKEAEVVTVRLENIKLKNRLRKKEAALKSKEELAEGLHLIDFEQLKIENQTYNEKIEERNEELLKLRRKITSTVQVLTHLKEKLQFVQNENHSEKTELREVEEFVGKRRDNLSRLKQARDALRFDNQNIHQKGGLLGNKALLRDFEDRKDETDELKQKLGQMRMRYAELTLNLNAVRKKIDESKSH